MTAAPDRLPAAWQADEATGAVWLTADDAAQGQPGLSWSDPARDRGCRDERSLGTSAATAEEPVAPARGCRGRPTCAEYGDLRSTARAAAERTPFAPNIGPLSHGAQVSKPAQYQTRP